MTPERWRQIEEIFNQALELPDVEREKFVRDSTTNDPELDVEVRRLLSQFDEANSFIEEPAYESAKSGLLLDLFDDSDDDPMVGRVLGSYRIEREIGRGGMGAVYEAVRADGEFRRRVAIKIVKRGIDTDFVLRRFRNERQILAALDHPFITRLIDGGTTDDGRPYFVMDYIDGAPLYRFADKNKLSTKQRLRLFCRIGEAVEYAHKRRVIHRDLKPSNIMVTADSQPRLLDFGIAKLLDPSMASDTLRPTATALRMMTVDYASPEQIRGEKVGFETDVYSMGVILYELLTGFRPYDVRSRASHEMARAICDEEPILPSEVVKSARGVPVPVNRAATTLIGPIDLSESHESLSQELSGDVDNIIMKALAKVPSDRYASIAEFCKDIDRYLRGESAEAPEFRPTGRLADPRVAAGSVKTLAVLPLRFLGAAQLENTDEAYLTVGLADSIITRLASVRQLIVRPTSSVTRYNNDEVEPLDAGRELGVHFVLDGRIRRIGERLRISLQLLDVDGGAAIWAGQFDEHLIDVLELEDAISSQVAEALIPQLTGEEKQLLAKRGTNDPRAYEAYLKGRFYWNQFTADSLPKAIEQFQKAVVLDPNYALAHVGIADFYNWANIYGLIPPLEADKLAKASIQRALAIDDQLGEAYTTLGLLELNHFNWGKAVGLQEKALALNPNYQHTHEWYAAVLVGTGRFADGLKEMDRAEELDPISLRTKTLTAWTNYQTGKFNEALAKANEIIELDEHYPQGHLQKGYILIEIGDPSEAVAEIEKGMKLMPDSPLAQYYYCFALAAAGRRDDARNVWAEMKTSSAYIKAMFLGLASVAVGEFDAAFDYFNNAADEFDPWLVWLGTEPKLKVIHSDERFVELLKRTNNPLLVRFEGRFAESDKRSIAILPLKLLGTPTGHPEDEYLGVGLADAMITKLSKVRRIVVRPTSSVLKFTDHDDALTAGRDLNVDFVLTGTLRGAGDRLRISTQLLDVAANSTIWADKFDEDWTEVLQLEDKVAEKVATLLLPQLAGDEQQKLAKRGTNKPEAFQAYVRGRTYWLSTTAEDLAKALVQFYEAIAIDPDYAAPYAGIADYHNFLSVLGIIEPKSSFPAAKENAKKALELDPDLAEAYISLGITSYAFDWEFEAADRYFQKALDLGPNLVNAHLWYAHFLSLMGRNDESIYHITRANDIAPKTYSTIVMHAFMLRNARRFAEAREKLLEAHDLAPNHYLAMQAFSWLVTGLENYEEAIDFCRRATELSSGLNMSTYALGLTFAAAGKRDDAERIVSQLLEIRDRVYVPPCYFALIYSVLGEKDKAFEWLEAAYTERDCWAPWLAVDPRFDGIRDDPRYDEMLERIGIAGNTGRYIAAGHTSLYALQPVTGEAPADTGGVELEKTTANPTFFSRHRFKLAAAAALLVVVVAGYSTGLLSIRFERGGSAVSSGDRKTGVRSVAVMPFRNLSGNAENDYLADGLSENLLERLSYSREIRVLPRSASFAYKGKDTSPQQVGSDLGADIVISGQVQKQNDSIEIVAEFLDVAQSKRIATIRYDGSASELISIQNRLAADATRELQADSGSQSRQVAGPAFTQNPNAFEQYLKGEFYRQKATPDDLKRAIEFYKKALEFDSNYALAHQGLALSYRMAPAYGAIAPKDAYPMAKQAALSALAIDPSLGSAHVPLASIKFVWEWDFAGAEAEYKQAIQLAPNNAEAHYSYGNFLVALGRSDEALNQLKIAQQLDPFSLLISSNIAWALYVSGRFDEAETQARQIIARDPNFGRGYMVLGEVYQEQGKFDDSIFAFQKSKQLAQDSISDMALGHVYAAAGRKSEAEKIAADLEAKGMKREVSPFLPAVVYAGLNQKDKSFYWLERAYQERSNWLTLIKVGRRLKNLHGDPRFDDLLQRIGF